MIIKSRVASSPYFRRTHIERPGEKTFSSVLQNLLVQWDILQAGSEASKVFEHSLLVTVVEGSDRLIVDKQSEWNLLCRDVATEENDIVVEIEIVLKSDLFLSSSSSKSAVRPAPRGEVQGASSSSERNQAAKPSFAFHSVEPQAPKKNPRTFSSKSSAPVSDVKATQQPFQLLSMDEIMARSRAQGESLNQLFGTMQARSAGRPHESEQAPQTQNQSESANDLVSSLPAPEQSDTGFEAGREEEPNVSQPSRSRVRSEEEIAEQNRQTETLWQERLAQMGHGPNSQSAYNRMRLGKAEARGDTPSELTTTSTSTSQNPVLPATPSLGAGRSPLVALDEVNEESTSRQPSQTFPTFTPIQTPDLEQGSSPFFEGGRWRRSRPNSSSGRSTPGPDESNSRPSSLRARLFRRHRHLSDVAAGSHSLQGRVDNSSVSGTSTPRSFNSIVFRRQGRPINARSLSDALLGTGRSRSGAESGTDGEQTDPPVRSESSRTISQVGKILPKVVRPGRRKSSPNTPQQETHSAEERADEGNGGDGLSSKAPKKTLRPSLMRASHSSPISATAVNLSGADGITLHVASVTASPFNIERDAGDPARPDASPHAPKIGKNLFEIMLPRELRIACLRSLVTLHEAEAAKIRDGSRLEVKRNASMQATRELVRLSRVSRQWQSLVYDGQLWQDLDVTMMRDISNDCLLRITKMAGPFVKRLNMSNMHGLSSEMLRAMNSCCVTESRNSVSTKPKVVRARSAARLSNTTTNTPLMNITFTSLTDLNLGGCRSLRTSALHHALVKLPQLQNLDMTGVPAVENATLVILGASLPHLRKLNVSRCINITGDGLNSFIDAAQGSLYDRALFTKRRQYPEIGNIALATTELRAAGLKEADNELMSAIGRSMPRLQVLDLSYAVDLSDDAVAAFVRHPGPDRLESKHRPGLSSQKMPEKHDSTSGPFVSLTARQSGGNPSFEDVTYRRHFEDLRLVNLSSCRSLTDRSCAHLAFAVPNLKCLELSNVGNAIRDDGIVKLLETTRYIERLDVEGASDLGASFIQALTPPVQYVESLGLPVVSGDTTIVSARISRRSARRTRAGFATDANPTLERREERTPWTTDVPTGAHLTHLIASHLSRLDANSLLTLVRRCPRLYHLEVDDTRANDALLTEFVTLARQRRKHGAYVSLVDCRAVTKATSSDVFAAGSARPRAGKMGDEYLAFAYEGAVSYHSASSSNKKKATEKSSETTRTDGLNASLRSSLPFATGSNSASGPPNECDESLVTVKTFWAWQAVDVRLRFKKKAEAKRLAALGRGRNAAEGDAGGRRARVDPLAAALSYISGGGGGGGGGGAYDSDDEEGHGRWGRIASNLLGNGDEGDDARGCSIM